MRRPAKKKTQEIKIHGKKRGSKYTCKQKGGKSGGERGEKTAKSFKQTVTDFGSPPLDLRYLHGKLSAM